MLFRSFINTRGSELEPGKESIRNEAIPKSASRVLNAQAIRDDWNLKKRKLDDGDDGKDGRGGKRRKTTATTTRRTITGSGGDKEKKTKKISLTIQPWESIENFNRSVTDYPSLKFFFILLLL